MTGVQTCALPIYKPRVYHNNKRTEYTAFPLPYVEPGAKIIPYHTCVYRKKQEYCNISEIVYIMFSHIFSIFLFLSNTGKRFHQRFPVFMTFCTSVGIWINCGALYNLHKLFYFVNVLILTAHNNRRHIYPDCSCQNFAAFPHTSCHIFSLPFPN